MCSDVVDNHNGYTMEEWLHFTETFSVYVLMGGVLTPLIAEMWALLREAVIFTFRAGEATTS